MIVVIVVKLDDVRRGGKAVRNIYIGIGQSFVG
jgi:hypothetical protein